MSAAASPPREGIESHSAFHFTTPSTGGLAHAGAFAAHFVEVHVDPDLGTIRVARVVSAVDGGKHFHRMLGSLALLAASNGKQAGLSPRTCARSPGNPCKLRYGVVTREVKLRRGGVFHWDARALYTSIESSRDASNLRPQSRPGAPVNDRTPFGGRADRGRAGKPLLSGAVYYWKVQLWGGEGRPVGWRQDGLFWRFLFATILPRLA